jgi:hypothetical protein
MAVHAISAHPPHRYFISLEKEKGAIFQVSNHQ